MKKPGEKGKCISCPYHHLGREEINAWCMYKNMRKIYGINLSSDDQVLRHKQLKEKYQGQLITKLQNTVNPGWCPLR
jgi:hypothetical protein